MECILDFHEFHKLWVIESLREGDLKTGTRLVEDRLLPAQSRHRNLEVVHRSPTTKSQLVKVLETIRDEALHQGLYPLIHFDCHGDLSCLQTTNGDQLTWEELRLLLIEINHACRCNLLIVVAACNGVHLIKCSTQLDRAPFYAVIGPNTKVEAGEIERDFQAFYSVLFQNLDGDDALRVLNNGKEGSQRTFHFVSSAGIFAAAYRTYYNDHCIGKGLASRREELLTTLLASPEVKKRGFRWIRKMIKEALSREDEHFVELRNRFFFLDKFPENKDRFNFSLSDVLQQGKLLQHKKTY
jgi:hypothetical protein